MPSKNDLSTIKAKSMNMLPDKKETKKTGRKPKPKNELWKHTIGLKFTDDEFQKIKKEAGLVPLATYLKNKIDLDN